MKIIKTIREMQSTAMRFQMKGTTIGFVPTMGALHEGHYSLVRRARAENDVVVVSIFVNPMQFGPKEDFKKYPRILSKDLEGLKKQSVDIVFVPDAKEMYPQGFSTVVDTPALTRTLCGPFRPHHFEGVATVVTKLFQITQPTRAYFGEKDYQQVRVIERVAMDLCIPVRVVACQTMREADGLAASSRNRYLSKAEREDAVKLYQTLFLGRELVEGKIITNAAQLIRRLTGVLKMVKNARIDYIEAVDPTTLQPMKIVRRPALLAAAVWIGKTRLIDNVVIS